MNGRIYDPALGRFLSPDIVVQMPHNIQSYNRYSYVLNNPLAYTDPSGYFIQLLAVAAFMVGAAYATDKDFGRMVLGIAVGFLLGPQGLFGAWLGGSGFATAVAAGFAAGGVSTGNIQGAFRGALSAGLFYGAGSFADAMQSGAGLEAGNASGAVFDSSDFAAARSAGSANSVWAHGGIGRAGLHAIAGCAGALGGGKCGSGALSAAFGEIAGPRLDAMNVPGIFSRAIVGGISSVLGGGKFENGAMTAAFGYLFNELAHTRGRAYDAAIDGPTRKMVLFSHSAEPGMWYASARDAGLKGFWNIYGHGDAEGLADLSRKDLSVDQLRDMMISQGWRGQPVALFACNCGGGSYAQNLANLLGVPVFAADGYYFFDAGGTGSRAGAHKSESMPAHLGMSRDSQNGSMKAFWPSRWK